MTNDGFNEYKTSSGDNLSIPSNTSSGEVLVASQQQPATETYQNQNNVSVSHHKSNSTLAPVTLTKIMKKDRPTGMRMKGTNFDLFSLKVQSEINTCFYLHYILFY